MSKQIIVLNNKIIDFGEDCFAPLANNKIFNIKTGEIFSNGVLINNISSFPEDLNKFNYDFSFGDFKKDIEKYQIYNTHYYGTGVNGLKIICGFTPKIIFLCGKYYDGHSGYGGTMKYVNKTYSSVSDSNTISFDEQGFTLKGNPFAYEYNMPYNETQVTVSTNQVATYSKGEYDILALG